MATRGSLRRLAVCLVVLGAWPAAAEEPDPAAVATARRLAAVYHADAMGEAIADDVLLDAAGAELRSLDQRESTAALVARALAAGTYPPALLERAVERFHGALDQADPAAVAPAVVARLRQVPARAVAERESLARVLGRCAARRPGRAEEWLAPLRAEPQLLLVARTAALAHELSGDREAGPALAPWLALLGTWPDGRAQAYACAAGILCGPEGERLAGLVFARKPQALGPQGEAGLRRILFGAGHREWAGMMPRPGEPGAEAWQGWLAEQVASGKISAADVLLFTGAEDDQ